jgi:hypothetical protein
MVSQLRNINFSVASFPCTVGGRFITEEIKAAWKETNL